MSSETLISAKWAIGRIIVSEARNIHICSEKIRVLFDVAKTAR
ncbi:31588_t:CDS:2 [Gigaspora margarita]|uniref:31588_t:CDS:1 n=1 Tax=Gigaspora margarita TaxID=4874 RepID=A0ABM8VXJ3_GIGMA|nr:31588_t:CDS:2 [Gigaspora margarita]